MIGQKIFDLLRIQHVAGDDEGVSLLGQSLLSLFAVKRGTFYLPNNRPLFTVFYAIGLPFLLGTGPEGHGDEGGKYYRCLTGIFIKV